MKVKPSVKPRCPRCKVIVRRRRYGKNAGKRVVFIDCTEPKHKQRQG